MTFPDPRLKGTSRRRFLGSALAAGVVLTAEATPITAFAADALAGDIPLNSTGISLLASPGGRLAIRDTAGGTTRSAGSKVMVKTKVGEEPTVTYTSTGGTPTSDALADGTPAIKIVYTFDAAAVAAGIAVVGWFSVSTNHAVLEWHITGRNTLLPDGFSFSRAIQFATEPDDYIAVTEWVRDSRGGIPYEDTAGVAHTSTWGTKHGLFLLEMSKQGWTNDTWMHAPSVAAPNDGWVSRADFYFTDKRPSATATIGHGDELGLELTTNADFNVYGAPGAPAQITALVANGGTTAKTVQLQLIMRDFDGIQLASLTMPGQVPATGTWQHTFNVAAPAAGIAFAEVVVRSGNDEAFARTNLATLPPYSYQAGATSMFGMANYPWLERPSLNAVLDLWQRIGVSLVRIGIKDGPGPDPSVYDGRGMRHNIELQPDIKTVDPEVITNWASSKLTVAVNSGAKYFEVGNELNRPFASGQFVAEYLDKALRPVFNRRAVTGDAIKLMNNGLAGMDKKWVDNFIALGGWDLIDAFAYHPGRGNFTPDYVPPGDWTGGPNGPYWNFAGGLQQLKALMTQHGQKEIWLTEAYAPTRPNSWWGDTYRHAAENVLLTLAISKAEGIKCVCWYQFQDSIVGMPQVADPLNTEYHFGLVNRDLSPKPSLLAYATAARTLDQATFRGKLTFANPKTFGLWFDTPAGPVTILWNRADGYILNTVGQRTDWHFPAPEVWVDTWPTKTTLTVAATAAVRQVDAIGRSKTLSPSNGRITLKLDGAPRIYHGLNPQTIQGVHRLPVCSG
ncbi:hypothetical protein E1263_01095 [Kribbella antibiotica]|uniref:Asl1-like glycosyl hydrolase catalytic domain-containing protein n=1 Tax=Kribbella antibiotica TaxID=190195 RepID=A0A4R4ZY20_9ACTN|nr:hypothetical protein [Kribbella antibiotica]TDD63254.1 hypothetical protein E1263_01095 [Kribbella antibiotica]